MGAKSHGVDSQLTERAVRALLKHHESTPSRALLGNDLDVQVQFALARIPGNPSAKPIRIEIPHPLVKVATPSPSENREGFSEEYDDSHLEDINACLIVKEDSKAWVQELVARFPIELNCVKKVLGLQSLRTKHGSFTQRRELLDRFDIFFADDRILPMLTQALGGKFFQKKKQPIPIRLSRKEALPFAIQNCLKSTFLYIGAGTCLTVKAGNTAMPPSNLVSNVLSICSTVPTKVPRKWLNIRSISLKTTASVALPIYNKTPEELEQLFELAKTEKTVAAVRDEKIGKNDIGVKTRQPSKATAKSNLAKALKKQQTTEGKEIEQKPAKEVLQEANMSAKKKKKKSTNETQEDMPIAKRTPKKPNAEANERAKTTTSSKKSKKATINSNSFGAEADAAPTKTPTSSKKKRSKEKADDSKSRKEAVLPDTKTQSSRKRKVKATLDGSITLTNSSKKSLEEAVVKSAAEEKHDFIPAKKFDGAKKGYVFKKSNLGVGYYKDVLPVIDESLLASGGKKASRGGRKSMVHSKKRKKGGSSRRSL